MLDALLVSDQNLSEGFSRAPSLPKGGPCFPSRPVGSPGLTFRRTARGNDTGVLSLREPAERKDQADQDMRWIADNRHLFPGKWVAIQGGQLLATGNTAKEVFGQVAGEAFPPLVVQVEDEDRPFAGW